MGSLGVHFAITKGHAKRLLSAEDDDALAEIVEEIEDEWDEPFVFETDKGWDALHRCLSNGTLDPEEGEKPLSLTFFGGKMLNEDVVLLTPADVSDVAKALAGVTEKWLRGRYFDLPFPDYDGEKSEEDWAYAWGQLQGLPDWIARVAKAKRHVIFTVSQ